MGASLEIKLARLKLTGRSKTIKYSCLGGFCTPTPRVIHVNRGDAIYLQATNTDVTVTFTNSPFVSGNKVFHISAGQTYGPEIVANFISLPIHFRYKIKCSKCPTLQNPPEMIVE